MPKLPVSSKFASLLRGLRLRRPSRRAWAVICVVAVLGLSVLASTGCLVHLTRPGVTLVVWDGPRWADENGNRYHWAQKKIAEFEASHPFVEVVFVPVEWNNLRAMLDVAKEAGRLPDVAPFDLSSGGVSLEEVAGGLLEPVGNHVSSLKNVSPQAVEAYTYDGRLWGFPSTMTGHALLLNLDLFAERGVAPPVNGKWTWDEFAAACRRLTFDRNGDGKTDVWGFSTYVLPGYYEVWSFLYADGARPLSDDLTTYTLDSEAGVSALKRLTDLIQVDKAAHPMTGSSSVRTVFDLFADKGRQEVAIEPWSAWAIDYLKTQDKAIKNFAVAEFPTGVTGGAVSVGGTGGLVVFRQEDVYRRGRAMELANYLTSAASQYELSKGYRVFPTRRAALELQPFAGDAAYEKAAEVAFQAVSLPKHPRWPEIERVIQREVQMALLGIKSPEEALRDAGATIKPLLAPPAETPAAPPGSGSGGG
jgi:multiple sugar transport system substrate-binding protein